MKALKSLAMSIAIIGSILLIAVFGEQFPNAFVAVGALFTAALFWAGVHTMMYGDWHDPDNLRGW